MKILVIGASGRVGTDLAKQLLADNHQVIGTTRKKKNCLPMTIIANSI